MSIFGIGHSKFLNTTTLTSGTLTSGKYYTITDYNASDNFENRGGPTADVGFDGETFLCTSTGAPTDWSAVSELHETVLLEHSLLTPDYAEPDEIVHKSILTGARSIVTNGDYVSFSVMVHLFKYADPAAKFSEIFAYNHSDVYFYPHEDGAAAGDDLGKAISDSATKTLSSSYVTFHITKIKPFYLAYDKGLDAHDSCEIEFIAKKYVDIENTVQ